MCQQHTHGTCRTVFTVTASKVQTRTRSRQQVQTQTRNKRATTRRDLGTVITIVVPGAQQCAQPGPLYSPGLPTPTSQHATPFVVTSVPEPKQANSKPTENTTFSARVRRQLHAHPKTTQLKITVHDRWTTTLHDRMYVRAGCAGTVVRRAACVLACHTPKSYTRHTTTRPGKQAIPVVQRSTAHGILTGRCVQAVLGWPSTQQPPP